MAQDVKQRGLQYWMERVLEEAGKAAASLDPHPVHDLRVALRRCRSIADCFRMLDPYPAWKKMRRACKPLFSSLGDLRDMHVQTEWVERLSVEDDAVRQKLLAHFRQREQELKEAATVALAEFDQQQWRDWIGVLGERTEQVPLSGEVFQVIALERWIDARRLHATAMKTRGKTALHQVRIGIKKFRYVVENFLPELHEAWIEDLKRMQDVLGEIHDLDVLSETARSVGAFETPVQRVTWRNAIAGERLQRLAQYRSRMLARSKNSLWTNWRAGLPDGEALHRAVLRKFEIWSALRDPDRLHTENVLELSLRIFDFLRDEKLLKFPDVDGISPRDLLNIAVLGHEAGHAKAGKHHKAVVKVFDKLDVPPGWSPVHLHMVGLIARYHIGAPPNEAQRQYASLRKSARQVVDRLAGILRLADAVERQRDMAAREVNIARNDGNIVISAAGVHDRTRQAERIASARHLLESVCGLPIVVRPM